jgi:hypothetical protein
LACFQKFSVPLTWLCISVKSLLWLMRQCLNLKHPTHIVAAQVVRKDNGNRYEHFLYTRQKGLEFGIEYPFDVNLNSYWIMIL